jgi:L-asparaginase/Glu-tRNA(Gln) amidotransferase subunit D
MKKAYYARPISVDNTPQEKRDHDLIRALGFEPYPIDEEKQAILARYREVGMEAFRPAVEASDALIFRAFPDGSIGAGVAQEIAWAVAAGVPVIEYPRQVERRTLSVDGTRAMLAELGQR